MSDPDYYKLEHSDEELENVHPSDKCAGDVCTIHNLSDHAMRGFPQHYREDRGIMERICTHGIGHPDPDDFRCRRSAWERVHGCDGCCLGAATKGPLKGVCGGSAPTSTVAPSGAPDGTRTGEDAQVESRGYLCACGYFALPPICTKCGRRYGS